MPVNLDEITALKDSSVFSLDRKFAEPFDPFGDAFVVGTTIEMNLDRRTLDRQTYSLTDALADIGGLAGLLNSVLSIIAITLNADRIERFLASSLFKIREAE